MTSIPEVPGAAAVYLFKEELADDGMHSQSFYYRIKVLTEGGKDYANVELPFVAGQAGFTIDSIAGRTIHSDGTIIPFTGKPYEKMVEKATYEGETYKFKVKVFSLPAVEVGSIIEYRYSLHTDDHYFRQPEWIVETELFTRKAHYMWRPTDQQLTVEDGKQITAGVMWTPILPPGVTVKQSKLMGSHGVDGGSTQLDLDVQNIMPLPKEQFMPPMKSVSYKVMFYYSPFRSGKEFWDSEGKRWSKARDKFIGPGSATKGAVAGLVAPGDSDEQKLHKLYTAVMTIENTDFTRQRSTTEERAQGLKDIKSADDVWTRKRGSGDQIAALFVGMARAAGMKAYLMGVANRSERFFIPSYLSLDQLDDDVAIVKLDGKDVFFDPGQRYCAFGHLSWKHSFTGGLRQTDGPPELATTPALSYKDAHVARIADLKLDDQGVATGIVKLTYTGDPALGWRQTSLRGDETSLKEDLKVELEHMLPGGMDISVKQIENLIDFEKPLVVSYDVKGAIGSSTGKRLLVTADLFETNSKPRFPETKRDVPIDMHYPGATQDAVRLTLPATLVVESSPAPAKAMLKTSAAFDTNVVKAPNSITCYRNLTLGLTLLGADVYPDLREFYGKVETTDQETVVLTRGAAISSGGN
jgi:hypothetical protein